MTTTIVGAELKDKYPGIIINFLIDESGSMMRKAPETIQGFNQYVKDRQESREAQRSGTVFFSLTKFSNKANVIYAAKDIKDIEPLNEQTYKPDGCTALLDAIGRTVDTVSDVIKDWEHKPAILTVIMTDGLENASSDYTHEQIKDKITEKEKEGNWTFVFLGATLDTIETAASYGIAKGNAAQYSISNIDAVMRGVSCSTQRYAHDTTEGVMQTNKFFDDSAANFVEDQS